MKRIAFLLIVTVFATWSTGAAEIVNGARSGLAYSNRPLYGGWSIQGLNDGNTQSV